MSQATDDSDRFDPELPGDDLFIMEYNNGAIGFFDAQLKGEFIRSDRPVQLSEWL